MEIKEKTNLEDTSTAEAAAAAIDLDAALLDVDRGCCARATALGRSAGLDCVVTRHIKRLAAGASLEREGGREIKERERWSVCRSSVVGGVIIGVRIPFTLRTGTTRRRECPSSS